MQRMTLLAMLVALGVVISPILRVEGMCPMAHFINIVCSVLLGPWYSLLCAVLIGILRMAFMGIPPLALTGAVFGAFLSGVLYRISKGRMIYAVVGEVIGTGIIGAIVSYPVMAGLMGRVSRRSGDGTAGEQRGGFHRDRGAGNPGFSGGVCGDEQFPAYDRRTDDWNSGGGISAGGTGGCCVFPCGSGRSPQRKRSAGVRTE